IHADGRGSFLGSRVAISGFWGFAGTWCGAFPGGLGAWRVAPPRHEGGGAGRRSRQAPSLAANAGPLRASCPPLRTSPLMTRRRTSGRWGRQGASAAQPRQARATVPEGGVAGPRPRRRRRFEEVVWGGRRPGFGDTDVAEKPTWTYSRRPG